ncbi:MAG: polysaccharide pyruvyl transferase family protein [Propioniciclava sp.]
MPKFRILLLTNRDSDNVGDQIIEATAISLIKGVMKNLGRSFEDFTITSRAASIVSRRYMKTGDPRLIETARRSISQSDVIIFGGAPLFNYAYQSFYLRTIKTLELAHEYNVPVIFSSIGVEPFDALDPRCLQLREALALPVVRQITTRDDLASLQRYVEGTGTPVAHVADPAVFADAVFRSRPVDRPSRSRVGLVVTRAGIFADNGIEFPEHVQRAFWRDVVALLNERGYEPRLLTTGHFTDEVFLDAFLRSEGIPVASAALPINSPEELVRELQACDGVIAFRLHASITSFAYGVPSIGLSWNFKVPYFYESVGYPDRAIPPAQWNAEHVVSALEQAMHEGVTKDEQFMMSVYTALFDGLKEVVAPDSTRTSFTFSELERELPPYPGTTAGQYRAKVRRKLRRTYENYQIHATSGSDEAGAGSRALSGLRAAWRRLPGRRRGR